MFNGSGIIEVNKGIRVKVGDDIIFYYRKLLNYHFYNTLKSQLPAYRAHISIILPDIHKGIDFMLAKEYDGLKVDFTYYPENIIITRKNIWMKVDLPIGDKIKKELNVVEDNFLNYHIVIVNFKFNN